jgi:hypothetical protein
LLTVSRVEPDAASLNITFALGTTDPDGSLTIPVRVAKIPWLQRFVVNNTNKAMGAKIFVVLAIKPPT